MSATPHSRNSFSYTNTPFTKVAPHHMTNCRYRFVRLRGLTCSTYEPSLSVPQ